MTQTHAPVAASDTTTATAAEEKDRLLRELLLEKYEPIAIVGVGLNLPGGNKSRSGFADFLRAGQSGISAIPEDRWDLGYFAASAPDEHGKVHTVAGGFIEGIDQFDPRFFNISPKEANYIDPQQRLVLETAWQALEDASIDPTPLRHGDGGVYVGISGVDWTVEVSDLRYDQLGPQVGTGTAHSAIPGRVSYFLGWRGPSLAIDTACSSSLAALHLAAEGLRRGECSIALCGGVNVIHHPRNHIVFSEANMLAPDGQCKTFDSSADGYSRSEGCGMVVLKRLSDARRDNNRILALVRGTAVRQDGESGGLTVPNGTAQEAVMRAALSRSMLRPEDIQYVEAHGTGTALGDPIEMGAISAIFANSHSHERPLVVGSVKTNIGHMEAAAGVGGLIKAVLQVAEPDIYPHLNMTAPSEHIPWQDFPVVVPSQPRPWPAGTRRAVVNSFGFAGSIASAVIEQAPASDSGTQAQTGLADAPHVFTVSGRTTQSLAEQIQSYLIFLEDAPDTDSVGPVCFTSNVGRSHFAVRVAAVVRNRDDLRTMLEKQMGHLSADPGTSRAPSKIAMLFTGQGSQYPGMGAAFYQRFPEFRAHVDECDRLFAPLLGRSIAAFLRGDIQDPEAINRTDLAQPALFTLEYATARLWMSLGVEPTVLVGHSIGELAAAAVSGLFSLPDAVTLVSARGRLMQSVTTPGAMVDVAAAADEVEPLLADYDDLAVAAVNAPGRCVLSGGTESLAAVVADLELRGIAVTALPVSHAFHSPLMREIADNFRQVLAGISFHEPQIALVSNLTGRIATPAELSTPEYWVRHIGEPVHFADGMQAIQERGRHIFLEVGPSSTLLTLGKLSVDAGQHQWFASHHQRDADVGLRSVAGLYVAGLPVAWQAFHAGGSQRTIDLPHHVFDHRRYWLPTDGNRHSATVQPDIGALRHPLLGDEIQADGTGPDQERVFRSRIRSDSPGWLAEHVVMGQVVFPGAGYVEVLLALLDEVDGSTARTLRDIRIHEPLLMPPGQAIELCTRIRPVGDAAVDIDISTRTHTPDGVIERVHVTAAVAGGAAEPQDADRLHQVMAELTALAGPTSVEVDVAAMEDRYAEFAELGLHYGPEFQRIQWLERHGDSTVRAQLRGRRTGATEQLPPEILDNAMQAVTALIADGETYLPVRFGRLRLLSKPKSATLRTVLRLAGGSGDDEMSVDLLVLDGDRPVAVVADLGLKKVKRVTARPARNGSPPESSEVNQSARGAGDRGRLGDDRFGRRVDLVHEPRWTKRSLVRPDGELASERRLLVINGQAPTTADLAREAQRRGIEITLAESGDSIADGLKTRPTDVVWYWQTESGPLGAERLQVEAERNFRNLLALLDSLAAAGFGRNQRLWLITRAAQQLPGDRFDPEGDADADLAAATLWGFGASLWNEYPSYRVTLVDLDAAGDSRPLLDECAAGSGDEYQLAFRNGLRHVRRIVAAPAQTGSDRDNEALSPGDGGSLSDLHLVPADDDPPEGDQIQVDIHAAGLNFKDVLNALGLLKLHAQENGAGYQPIPLGFEGSGTVLAAGPESTFQIGDPVVISHSGCLRRRITVPSSSAVRKPAAIDFEQAAGYPTAYITAHHALHRLADMKAGDLVLVHAAAGGVGQAAVHLAQRAGAIIFATASPRKHDLLRAQGIEHIFNSRSVDFAEEILDVTGGRGVDIVLNSLNKDYVEAGMRALGQGGRFVELGKIGIWSAERAHRARPDVTYFNFDLAELPPADWQRFNSESLHFVTDLISRGELPALPTTTYALDEAEEAFGVLSRGANVGKLVLSMNDQPVPRPAVKIRPDRCYLLSGGRGALGAVTARKLVGLGARELMFVNRSPVDQASIDELARAVGGEDVRIRMVQCDVADPADVRALAQELARSDRPLGGVIHAAGVLADMPVSAMTWDDIDRCLRPKMIGGWLLHELAGSFPDVEFFVGFSSVAALLGPVAQANYAAANAFVDNLMRWRDTRNLPGLSINWGPWAEAGMAAALDDRRAADIEGQGIRFLKPAVGTRMLVKALSRPEPQLVIGEFDWDKVVGRHTQPNSFYSRVASATTSTFTALDLTVLRAQPRGAWAAVVNEVIRATLARMLQFDGPQDVATDARFLDLGVDSLVAVELKNNLETTFMLPLNTSIVFDFPTVDLMAEMIVAQLTAEPSTANTDEPDPVTDQATRSASPEVAR